MRLNPVMNSYTSHKTYTFTQNNINCTFTENDIITLSLPLIMLVIMIFSILKIMVKKSHYMY